MCGIVCAFDLKQKSEVLRPQLLEMSKKIRHRGPDWSGIYDDEKAILTHERLAIVDPTSGKQPLYSEDKKLILAANGEIYNHLELRKQFEGKYNFQTASDCEVIIPLYKEKGVDFLDEMNVEVICTTDDLLSNLKYHKLIHQDESITIKVLPTFRPDRLFDNDDDCGDTRLLYARFDDGVVQLGQYQSPTEIKKIC